MQSVIVYRNPLEAAIWEGIMNGSFAGPVIFLVSFLVIILALDSLGRKMFAFKTRNTSFYTWGLLGVTAALSFAIAFKFCLTFQ